MVWGWEEKLQVVPQARVHVGGHARLVEYPARACVAGPLCGLEADCGDLRTSGQWLWVLRSRRRAVCLVQAAFTSSPMASP